MISIDRDAPISVHRQLVDQIRFAIASGKYPVGSLLPSTRKLAAALDISFHTVRKAYAVLEDEGLLTSKTGSGYRVQERLSLSKSERMERGAGIVQDALKNLMGLGFTESEIEYLVDEQLSLLDQQHAETKVLFVAEYREKSVMCAARVAAVLQRNIEPVTPAQLDNHLDADLALAPFDLVRTTMEALPGVDVVGVTGFLRKDVLDRVSRLLPGQTLGVVARYEDALSPLAAEVRKSAGFGGNVIGTTVGGAQMPLTNVLKQADLIIYTPAARRALAGIAGDLHTAEIRYSLAPESLDQLKEQVRG